MTHARSLALLAVTAAAACSPPPATTVSCPAASPAAPPPGFTVVGTATIDVAPDTADLHVTVSAQAARPAAATKAARDRQRRLIAGLGALGIAARDVQLAALEIAPVWDEKYTRVVGYRAAIAATASTRDFDQVGAMMEAAADAGATDMSTTFRADLPARKREARDLALAAAKDKAAQIAAALDVTLGAVTAIDEGGASPLGYYAPAVENVHVDQPAPAAATTTAAPQPLTVTISVTYALS